MQHINQQCSTTQPNNNNDHKKITFQAHNNCSFNNTALNKKYPDMCPDQKKSALEALEEQFNYRIPGQHFYKGIMLNSLCPSDRLEELDNFDVRADDILVSGYPKSGTTWLEEVVYLVQNNGDIAFSNKVPVFVRVPFLEGYHDSERLPKTDSPRVYKTHLPYRLLPTHFADVQIKIIHIMRNPKDTAVSYFHFYRSLVELGRYQGTWADFLEMFLSGYMCCGDWAEHARDWWSHRSEPNLLIVTYEDMKKDPYKVIGTIAEFCDRDLDPETVESIVQHTSFDNMKSNPMLNFQCVPNIDHNISAFMRKGQIGDWKNHFTVAQNERFDRWYQEKLGDLPDIPLNISQ